MTHISPNQAVREHNKRVMGRHNASGMLVHQLVSPASKHPVRFLLKPRIKLIKTKVLNGLGIAAHPSFGHFSKRSSSMTENDNNNGSCCTYLCSSCPWQVSGDKYLLRAQIRGSSLQSSLKNHPVAKTPTPQEGTTPVSCQNFELAQNPTILHQQQ